MSAKKEAILAAALDAFSQFGISTARGLSRLQSWSVSKTNPLLLSVERGCMSPYLQQILTIWLAPL